MDYEIKENEVRSGFNCYFSVGEKQFYADITDFPFGNAECMIFSISKRGEIDWGGVYQNRKVEVSKQDLKSCIKEFSDTLA